MRRRILLQKIRWRFGSRFAYTIFMANSTYCFYMFGVLFLADKSHFNFLIHLWHFSTIFSALIRRTRKKMTKVICIKIYWNQSLSLPLDLFSLSHYWISAKSTSGRNLWVSGLSSSTRATDLKSLFSKYGKVGLFC